MISQQAFYGGSQYQTILNTGIPGVLTLSSVSPMTQVIDSDGGPNEIALPADSSIDGGPRFVIHNQGPENLSVTGTLGAELALLTAGDSVSIYYVNGVPRASAIRSGSPVATATGDFAVPSSTPDTGPRTYTDEDCGDTSGACSGVTEAVEDSFPLYMDPHIAQNQARDAIRAADVKIPTQIGLLFKNGIVADGLHGSGGAGTELLEALTQEHTLTFDDTMTAEGTSRHPYHCRVVIAGASYDWTHNSPNVKRWVWKKSMTYTQGAFTRTLEIRFVAELPWDPMIPGYDKEGGSWGTLFHVYVFDDSISEYVDGEPDPDQEDIEFTKSDPVVWGEIEGAPEQKYFHPSLVVAASVVTSFHMPIGTSWVPLDDILRSTCYALANGAPWSDNTPSGAIANSVFRDESGEWAAMTIGGDAPTSALYPVICIENGAGGGKTAAKPTYPGWSESLGELTIGSDIELSICEYDQSSVAIDPCEGHPDQPYGGVGGTHRCFKTSDNTTWCCYSLAEGDAPRVRFIRKCADVITTCNSDCSSSVVTCELYGTLEKDVTLSIYDYQFPDSGSVGRGIYWKKGFSDFNYSPFQYDPGSGVVLPSLSDSSQEKGTWDRSDNINLYCSSHDASGPNTDLRAYWEYDPTSGGGFYHGRVEVDYEIHTTNRPVHGIALRVTPYFAGWDMYAGVFSTRTNTLRIIKWKSGVKSVLVEESGIVDNEVTGGTLVFEAQGSVLTLVLKDNLGAEIGSVTADDCGIQGGGKVGLVVTDEAHTESHFSNFRVTDDVPNLSYPGLYTSQQVWAELQVYTTSDSSEVVSVNMDAEADRTAQDCLDSSTPSPCCDSFDLPTCGRACHQHFVYGALAVASAVSGVPTTNFGPLGGVEVDCGGTCYDCPPPWKNIEISFPAQCSEREDPDTIHIYCAGAEFWSTSGAFIVGGP